MCARLVIKRSWVRPPPGRQHSFVEIDHEIFLTVIQAVTLIQEGQLSVSGEGMRTILVKSVTSKSVVRSSDRARHHPSGLFGP